MAFDKVIDSTQLDAAMTYTAGRIRNKTGNTNQIMWDSAKGFGDAVDAITEGSSAPESDPRRSLIRAKYIRALVLPSGFGCRIMTKLQTGRCIVLLSYFQTALTKYHLGLGAKALAQCMPEKLSTVSLWHLKTTSQ